MVSLANYLAQRKPRDGKMKAILRFQLPATVGSDLAGVVLEVGHHVTRFKPGDAVLTSFVLVTCI